MSIEPGLLGQPTFIDCAAVMQKHAQSFSQAARFLAESTRPRVQMLYALARGADDLADDATLASAQERALALAQLLDEVRRPDARGSFAQATAAMLASEGASMSVLLALMQSLQADMGPRRLVSLDELLQYAYGVAGTVGLLMRPLLGAPAAADSHALALGIAMQLTNVARDVRQDAADGRQYVPSEGVGGPSPSDVFEVLAVADALYAYAAQGFRHIPQPNRRAIRLAMQLYQSIGHGVRAHMLRTGEIPAHRVVVAPLRRTCLVARCLALGRLQDWHASWRLRRGALAGARNSGLALALIARLAQTAKL